MKENRTAGDFPAIAMMLLILGALVSLSYYIFFKPALVGFPDEDGSSAPAARAAGKRELTPGLTSERLYFSNPEGKMLVPEDRPLSRGGSVPERAKAVLQALIAGPTTPNLASTIPKETEVRAVFLLDDTLVVDFSKELVTKHTGGVSAEVMTVYSIVNTVSDLPGVKRVQILVNDLPVPTLLGHFDLRTPVVPDRSLISAS